MRAPIWAYKYATINQHRLGTEEPIRVRQAQRGLMRLLNLSKTMMLLHGQLHMGFGLIQDGG
jgi:hypothetical protein